MAFSASSGLTGSRRPLRSWMKLLVAVATASFVLAWLYPCAGFTSLYCAASYFGGPEQFAVHGAIGALAVIALLFISWALSLLWCILFITALIRLGNAGLWLLVSAPLVALGPALLAFELLAPQIL